MPILETQLNARSADFQANAAAMRALVAAFADVLRETLARGDKYAIKDVVRIMRDGTSDLFATGRYLDRYEIQNETALLKERIVVCDSSRIDTLLAIPL